MNTAHSAAGLGRTTVSMRCGSSFFKRYWSAFQERRKRQRLRAELYRLSQWELMDMGMTRGDIEYVVLNRSTDPRSVRSTPPMNV